MADRPKVPPPRIDEHPEAPLIMDNSQPAASKRFFSPITSIVTKTKISLFLECAKQHTGEQEVCNTTQGHIYTLRLRAKTSPHLG
ncbi:hypothetical protein BLNAU_15553 [Blattamonas nauphoetae]|uniref:Uncharacterized protein n=1 Tax=Blattamonas nauphoetae TaxID=2049346 RepID=A0ABQ9XH02_9EUKA|nr:hypothetical protein BLNAU_15553 [Blattamonas nauphoetae]